MKKVDSGIYRHFKGNFYFVMGSANDGAYPLDDDTSLVFYHPLYQVENIGWRYRSIKEFFEDVRVPGLNGTFNRFRKIIDWDLPNILPGTVFDNYPTNEKSELHTIKRVVEINFEIFVEAEYVSTIRHFPIKVFSVLPQKLR